MTVAAVAALLASAGWTCLAVLTAGSLLRVRCRRDARELGVAFLLVALVAAPVHAGAGLALLERDGPLPLVQAMAQVVGLLPLAGYAALRLEAVVFGRAERLVRELPAWLPAIPALAAFAGGAAGWEAVSHAHAAGGAGGTRPLLGAALLVLGGVVGILVIRAQEVGRRARGGWTASALMLSALFPAMGYALGIDVVLQPREDAVLALQAAAVPAFGLLLLVARRLHRRGVRRSQQRPLVGPAARAARRSPWEAPAAP